MAKLKSGNSEQLYETYLCHISDWDLSYSFDVTPEWRSDTRRYSEYCNLEVHGEFTHPPKLSGRDLKMMLLGRRDGELQSEDRGKVLEYDPIAVGSLTVRGDRREYLASIPYTAFWGLVPALEAKRIASVCLQGEPLRYGKALIRSMQFAAFHHPDDY